MADILASVSVVLGAEISGFKAAMAQAQKDLRGLRQAGEAMRDVGESLSKYVSLPLAALGTAAVAASAKMESLKKGLEAISLQDLGKQGVTGLTAVQQAAQLTGERLQVLQQIAKAPGIGFEEAVKGDVRLRAVGISAQQSAVILREFANAIALTGGGAAELNSVTVQLAQLSAKGKVLAQDLRPIIEAAPSVATALQQLFGTVDSETISAQLQKAGQSSSDFIARLTTELAKAPRVTGGLANAFENLGQTTTQSLARIGDALSKGLNLPAVVSKLSDTIEGLGAGFGNLSPGVQKAAVVLGGVAAAIGPALVAVGSLGVALPAIQAGFATLGITTLSALAPVGLAIGAVAAGAYLIIDNWGAITDYFGPSGEGGRLFRELAASVKQSVGEIGQAIGALGSLGKNNLGGLVSASGVIKALVRDIATGFTAISEVAGGTVKYVSSLLQGDLTQALQGARQAAYGLLDPLANLIGLTKNVSTTTFAELFKDLLPTAAGAKIELDEVALATKFLGGQAEGATGILAKLKEELKAFRESRDNATSSEQIGFDNAQIKSLEEQIKKLEGTDKAANKAAEAIKHLRAELSAQATLAKIFPDPSAFADTQERIKLLENGLKTLVTAGVSPASQAFKAFVAEASTLGQGLAKKFASGPLQITVPEVKTNLPKTLGDTLPADVARLLGDYAKTAVPIELRVPIRVSPIANGLTDFSKNLQAELLAVGQAFRVADGSGALFGENFDVAGAKAQALQSTLQNLLASGISPLSPALQQLAADLRAQQTASVEFQAATNRNQQAAAALKAAFTEMASGIGDAFATITSGTGSFGDALEQALLGTIGNLATQLGQIILAAGVGIETLKVSLSSFVGVGAIAAGLGLIAIGGLAKGAASRLASSSTSSAAGISTAGFSTSVNTQRSFTPTTAPAPAGYSSSTNVHKIQVAIQGNQLVGLLQLETDRLGRVVGSR